jgi:hypothetical protein
MSKTEPDLKNSYLAFFPDIAFGDVSVFRFQGDDCNEKTDEPGNNSSCNLIITRWKEKKNKRHLLHWTDTIGLQKEMHILFDPAAGRLENMIRCLYIWKIKQHLHHTRQATCHLLGVMGSPWSPSAVVPLQTNILTYVMTLAFRFLDRPFKVSAKKLMCRILGPAVWTDTIVLVARQRG